MKTTVYVDLSSAELIQSFVNILTQLKGDFELVSGGYILDGRSLMGIFSLDRTRPVQLNIDSDSEFDTNALSTFITDKEEAR